MIFWHLIQPLGLLCKCIGYNKPLIWNCPLAAAVDSPKHRYILHTDPLTQLSSLCLPPVNVSKQQRTVLSASLDGRVVPTVWTYFSALERLFRAFFGLRLLPRHGAPSGPVTLTASSPLDDFLKVKSRASPSLRLRKPSMCSLLCQWRRRRRQHM